jgi:hypothetical protein
MFDREHFILELKKNISVLEGKEFVEYKEIVKLLDITILRSRNTSKNILTEIENLVNKLQKTDLECKEC